MTCRWSKLVVLCSLNLALAAAQLPAPMTSDAGFSECTRDSCLFVPDGPPKIYRHGDYEYSADENGAFVLRRADHAILSTKLKNWNASVYVVWSEDSSWFAVTWSDGGAIGNFHTRLFHARAGVITESHSVEPAFAAFRRRHYCKTSGDNVQAYGWDSASGGIMLVMSVYPTSDCGRDLGHTEGYLIRPESGAILQHLTVTQLNTYIEMHPVP
jgi:hypothetical protein